MLGLARNFFGLCWLCIELRLIGLLFGSSVASRTWPTVRRGPAHCGGGSSLSLASHRQWVVGRLQPNSSFKPTPLHGIVLSFGVRLLSLRLHLVAARLNSGVRRGEKQFALMLLVVSHFFTASRLIDFALDRWLRGGARLAAFIASAARALASPCFAWL